MRAIVKNLGLHHLEINRSFFAKSIVFTWILSKRQHGIHSNDSLTTAPIVPNGLLLLYSHIISNYDKFKL